MFGCQALGAGSSWMGRRERAETTDVSPASATSAAVRTKESSPHLRSFSITILCEQAARVGYKCLLVVNIATAKSCNQSNWLTRLRQTMYFDLRLKNRSWLASTLKAKLGLSSDLHYVKFNGRSKIIVFSNFSASHLVRRWCPIELTGFKGCCWKSIHFFHVLLAKNKVSDFDKRDFECHVLDRHRICKMCETQSKEWNADLSKTFIELLKKLKPSREQRLKRLLQKHCHVVPLQVTAWRHAADPAKWWQQRATDQDRHPQQGRHRSGTFNSCSDVVTNALTRQWGYEYMDAVLCYCRDEPKSLCALKCSRKNYVWFQISKVRKCFVVCSLLLFCSARVSLFRSC